jgi:hypothetical protein
MREFLKNVTDGLIPAVTRNVSTAAQTAIDGAKTMLTPRAGVIRVDGEINQNPQSFGFAFEHLQAIAYNIKAGLAGSENRAWQIPLDGTKSGPDIYVTDAVGRTIAEIQAKVGSVDYVSKQVASGHYEGQQIVVDAANKGIDGANVVINVDGIQSMPIDRATAEWVAQNPCEAAILLETAAFGGEVLTGGVSGAAINATITVMLQSIKLIGAYCRDEETISAELLQEFQSATLEALSSGFLRGAAIKILQRLVGGSGFAALGLAVRAEAVPALMRVLQGEQSLEEAVAQVGPRAVTAGMVTMVVLLIPPLGAVLFSASILQAIWVELTPEYKDYIVWSVKTAARGAVVGVQAGQAHCKTNSWDLLGASSASATASSAEMQTLQNELDALLE